MSLNARSTWSLYKEANVFAHMYLPMYVHMYVSIYLYIKHAKYPGAQIRDRLPIYQTMSRVKIIFFLLYKDKFAFKKILNEVSCSLEDLGRTVSLKVMQLSV